MEILKKKKKIGKRHWDILHQRRTQESIGLVSGFVNPEAFLFDG